MKPYIPRFNELLRKKYPLEGQYDPYKAAEKWEDHRKRGYINHTLCRSLKGSYYIWLQSRLDWVKSAAYPISPLEAAEWLLEVGHELPPDLEQFKEEIDLPDPSTAVQQWHRGKETLYLSPKGRYYAFWGNTYFFLSHREAKEWLKGTNLCDLSWKEKNK